MNTKQLKEHSSNNNCYYFYVENLLIEDNKEFEYFAEELTKSIKAAAQNEGVAKGY